jgi:hypothetical protein
MFAQWTCIGQSCCNKIHTSESVCKECSLGTERQPVLIKDLPQDFMKDFGISGKVLAAWFQAFEEEEEAHKKELEILARQRETQREALCRRVLQVPVNARDEYLIETFEQDAGQDLFEVRIGRKFISTTPFLSMEIETPQVIHRDLSYKKAKAIARRISGCTGIVFTGW